MTPTSIGILAVGMSVDAMVVALGRGAVRRHGLVAALGAGAVFGLVEAITPLIGWTLGLLASQYVQAVDHWIAFGLLSVIGARMVMHALRPGDTAPRVGGSLWALVATAVGTSVDAMAVGVSLAFLEVNILIVAGAIGLATMCMATAGMMAGRYLGNRFGRTAEVLGGIGLIGLGGMILVDHLFLA